MPKRRRTSTLDGYHARAVRRRTQQQHPSEAATDDTANLPATVSEPPVTNATINQHPEIAPTTVHTNTVVQPAPATVAALNLHPEQPSEPPVTIATINQHPEIAPTTVHTNTVVQPAPLHPEVPTVNQLHATPLPHPPVIMNGTRCIITRLWRNVLEVTVATGPYQGDTALIPRIPLQPSDTTLPFTFQRKQFPVRPCFGMTINKAQGQTLKVVGLCLANPVFSHGMLYVGLSRTGTKDAVFMQSAGTSRNVVYTEVLQ